MVNYNSLVDSSGTRNNFAAWATWGTFSCSLPSCHWVEELYEKNLGFWPGFRSLIKRVTQRH